ncbi:MAG: ABC transporter permease [Candidatus Bipolaricaulaceae bacterium]
MTAFRALVRTQVLVFLRDKLYLFFLLFFPLVFVLIFGFVWGGIGGAQTARLGLVVSPGAEAEVLEEVLAGQGSLQIRRYQDRKGLEEDLARDEVDFGLVWDGRALLFLYDPTRVQENPMFQEVARGISTEFDLRRQGLSPVAGVDQVNLGRAASARWFNMLVPGIMAFSVLTSGLFAVAGRLAYMKERKLLDRLLATPMSPGALLFAIACVWVVMGYLSALLTLMMAVTVFRADLQVNWPMYSAFVVAGALGSMGLGTVIALVVRRPGSAITVANILAQAMLFLSGVYFPTEFMPPALRAVSHGLPLTYMVEGMRYVTGVADMAPAKFLATTGGLALLGLVLLPALARYAVRPHRG